MFRFNKIRNLFRRPPRQAGKVEWLHANVPRHREQTGHHRLIAAGLLVLLVLLCLLVYIFHFRRNSQFLLSNLVVNRSAMISEDVVRGLIQRKLREPMSNKPIFLFGFSIEDLREELKQLSPGIRSVSVTRRLPASLDVRIVERDPVGRICVKNDDQVIDDEGVIFPRNFGVEHLPRIEGLDGIPLESGARLDGMGLAAVRLLAAIKRPEYSLPVAAVDVSHSDYLFIKLHDSRQIKLWWKGMSAVSGDGSREVLGKRLSRLLRVMAMAPQRQVWDATVPDDNRIFTPY